MYFHFGPGMHPLASTVSMCSSNFTSFPALQELNPNLQAFPFAGVLKLASHSHLRFVGLIPFCVFFTLEVGNPEWAKLLI
ncbi:hypothetical protein Csa_001379 [Cucumis sativus]|uniref:Uncharacterized protein n=1 Tax=Cucumis sativus TaxID=3659 RepID=A0A0A0L9I3_CUCSA|nr:hypothetical protein Csa_001379 [Cucumis sativus]